MKTRVEVNLTDDQISDLIGGSPITIEIKAVPKPEPVNRELVPIEVKRMLGIDGKELTFLRETNRLPSIYKGKKTYRYELNAVLAYKEKRDQGKL